MSTAIASRLLAQAETIQRKISDLEQPRNDNTPKRQCQAMSRRCEAANLERVRRAMVALAAAHNNGGAPAALAALKTKAEIEPLVTRQIDHPSYYVVCESSKWRDDSPLARSLREFVESRNGHNAEADAKREREAKIQRLLDEVRFVPIPGFFPTPERLISRLLVLADGPRGMRCLEPSAGAGHIADRLRDCGQVVECVELNHRLADILRAKGHEVFTGDFLTEVPPVPTFDRVVMNPPFENGQDMAHVRRAFEFLKPGGRLVSLMSASVTFNQSAKAAAFRTWVDGLGGEIHEVEPDAFKGAFRETGVSCVIVEIEAR
ncbi:MAG: hypothetical protein AB7I42_24125 [Bradyrhizobium sp.]|uniref:methyltransferase domain-containing protein n=1 Tax=Bradyrhizobium sp. TaxID=376 RepID=UPI003D1158DA